MKILLTELYPSVGHRKLLLNTYKMLENNFDVTLVVPCDDNLAIRENIVKSPYKVLKFTNENINYRRIKTVKNSVQIMKFIAKLDKEREFDYIICLTYHTVSFFIGQFFFKKTKKILLMHHDNIDGIKLNTIKRAMFNSFARKVGHIVQCGYMKRDLVKEYGINENSILVWLHPLNILGEEKKQTDTYDCVGISGSNDESLIEELLYKEINTSFLKDNGLRIVLKSKTFLFDNGYLKIINSYLSDSEYENYIAKAKCIFLPFPNSFENRMSGTLIDAFTNNKPIITTDLRLFQECKKTYPNIVKFYNIDNFHNDVISWKIKNKIMEDEFLKFQRIHSAEKLANEMKEGLILYSNDLGYQVQEDF